VISFTESEILALDELKGLNYSYIPDPRNRPIRLGSRLGGRPDYKQEDRFHSPGFPLMNNHQLITKIFILLLALPIYYLYHSEVKALHRRFEIHKQKEKK
jgi:hypothetical protein